jgi:hypothetical protein
VRRTFKAFLEFFNVSQLAFGTGNQCAAGSILPAAGFVSPAAGLSDAIEAAGGSRALAGEISCRSDTGSAAGLEASATGSAAVLAAADTAAKASASPAPN